MLDSNKLAPACDSVNYWKGYIISELANGQGDTGREFNIGRLRMGQNSKVTELDMDGLNTGPLYA